MPFAALEIMVGLTVYRVCARGPSLTEQGRALSGSAAERVIARLLRSGDGASVRRAYAKLTQSVSPSHVGDDVVLRWFARALGALGGGQLVLLEVKAPSRGEPPRAAPPTPAQELLDELHAQRGADLQVSGYSYRLVVAADQAELPGRSFFEAISPKEAKALLQASAAEPRYAKQSELLRAATAFVEPQIDPRAQLVVLRRQRHFARANEESKPLTPSQIRESNERHWIEFRLVDDKGTPYANEAFTIKAPNGETRSGVTDENGIAHVKGLVSGNCELSFPKLKQKSGPSSNAA